MVAILKLKGHTLTFSESDKLESFATWHMTPGDEHEHTELNQSQAIKLNKNILDKRVALIQTAVRSHLGHLPSNKKVERYMNIIDDDKLKVKWLYWRKTCLAVYTMPVSRIENKRYYLTWWWKAVTQ